jgi:hypothetical protein
MQELKHERKEWEPYGNILGKLKETLKEARTSEHDLN